MRGTKFSLILIVISPNPVGAVSNRISPNPVGAVSNRTDSEYIGDSKSYHAVHTRFHLNRAYLLSDFM